MDKGIKNINAVACKFRLASIRATNYRLEVASKKRQKREEMVKRQKTKAIGAKRQSSRKGICLSNKEKEDYEGDTRDKKDPDQSNNQYMLQF